MHNLQLKVAITMKSGNLSNLDVLCAAKIRVRGNWSDLDVLYAAIGGWSC